MDKKKQGKFTVERVYLTYKPIPVNSSFSQNTTNKSNGNDGFTENDLEKAIEKVSRPLKHKRDQEKK